MLFLKLCISKKKKKPRNRNRGRFFFFFCSKNRTRTHKMDWGSCRRHVSTENNKKKTTNVIFYPLFPTYYHTSPDKCNFNNDIIRNAYTVKFAFRLYPIRFYVMLVRILWITYYYYSTRILFYHGALYTDTGFQFERDTAECVFLY